MATLSIGATVTSTGRAGTREIMRPSIPITASGSALRTPSGRVSAERRALITPSLGTIGGGLRLTSPSVVSVPFAFDRSAISSRRQRAIIAGAAAWLRTVPAGTEIRIDGHTDSRGTDSYNDDLGARRATAVRRALQRVLRGRSADLTARSFGDRRPCSENRHADGTDDPAGRARNRRVEIYAVQGDPRRIMAMVALPCSF